MLVCTNEDILCHSVSFWLDKIGTRGAREVHERGTRGAREVHERCTRGPQEGHERGTRGALSWAVKGSQYFLF